MLNELSELQKRLIHLTDAHRDLAEGHCKAFEPAITVYVIHDYLGEETWTAEIYSYLMSFHDGGRVHNFEADSYEELLKKLTGAVEQEEAKLKIDLENVKKHGKNPDGYVVKKLLGG